MQPALYFEKLSDSKVRCQLCPRGCILKSGQTGNCRVRTNKEGELISDNYGMVSALHIDPIEKKPLYHFFPGKSIFSIGSVGCNLHCNFCQNFEISQTGVFDFPGLRYVSSKEIVDTALHIPDNIGIAFTYNEPTVYYEFMLDTAKLSKEKKLYNAMVSNGYINEKPLLELLPWIDAFNIDLKAMNDDFYRNQTYSHLEPVQRSLQLIHEAGKHLEITNLVIPGLNDNEYNYKNMILWISKNLGEDTVLHLSRYFPRYKATQPVTSEAILIKFRKIAMENLRYVYIGNANAGDHSNDTICHSCKNLLIERFGYSVTIKGLNSEGYCNNCGEKIIKM